MDQQQKNYNYKNEHMQMERINFATETPYDVGGETVTLSGVRRVTEFHVIIESKVKSNKVRQQRTQYLRSFDNERKKVLCFITGVNDFNKEIHDEIEIHNLGWLEILGLFDQPKFKNIKLIRDFLDFMRKGFNMREQKEILVQDIGNKKEIKRFRDFQVYRRDVSHE